MKFPFVCRRGIVWPALLVLSIAGCASYAPAPVVERSKTPSESAATATTGVPALVSGKDAYIVKKGDTLYSIALEHGLDYKEFAAWNALDNPNRLSVGQVLRIAPPADSSAMAPTAVAKPIGLAGAVEKRSLDGNTDTLKREPKAGKEPYSEEVYARLNPSAVPLAAKLEAKPEPRTEPKAEPKPVDAADDPVWMWPANGKMLAGFNEATNKGVDIAGKPGDAVVAAGDGKVVYSGTGLRGYGQLVIVKHNATYLSAYAHNSKILVAEGQSVTRGQKIAEMGNTDADQVKLHFEVRRQGKPVDPLKYLPSR